MPKPNILLIILDTQRRDRLSGYGYGRETSPELDSLTGDATVFERAIAPAQWTIPAHASIFTGLYPGVHGLTQADEMLMPELPTLAEILRNTGYQTVGFCNNPLVGVLDNGLQRGFEQFFNYAGATPYRPVDMTRSRSRRKLVRRFRRVARSVTNQFAQSDLLFRLSLNPLFVPLWTRFTNYKGHTEKSINDLIDYWGEYSAGGADKPLFTFLNLMGTHMPYRPPQDYVDRLAPELRRDKHAYRFMRQFNTDAARWASPSVPPLTEWERAVIDGFYDAEISHQDYHLGRLLRFLRDSGELDNTMVIITADHGEGHGDHNFFGHSFVVYQELVHVPLIIHHPQQFPAGKRVSTNISTRRIYHTVLDTVGLKSNTDSPDGNISALSLAHSLNGRPDAEGGLAFAEAFPPLTFLNVMKHRNPSLIDSLRLRQVRRGVYSGAHKLAMVGGQVEGLFDVALDPAEMQDVAGDNPAVVEDLQRQIGFFVAETESQRAAAGQFGGVDEDVVENLRALGYIE